MKPLAECTTAPSGDSRGRHMDLARANGSYLRTYPPRVSRVAATVVVVLAAILLSDLIDRAQPSGHADRVVQRPEVLGILGAAGLLPDGAALGEPILEVTGEGLA